MSMGKWAFCSSGDGCGAVREFPSPRRVSNYDLPVSPVPERRPEPAAADPRAPGLAAFVAANLPHALAAARSAIGAAGVRDDDLAQDAAHDGVTEAWTAVRGREAEWPADIAARTVARRRALDLLRRRLARTRRERASVSTECRDPTPGPLELAAAEEVCARVREALEALAPEERRWLAALVAHEGPTAAAAALGMPKSSYRSRVERVCEALRFRLRALATASVLALVGVGALSSPCGTDRAPTFAYRAERPGTRALVEELRAEAAHYRNAPATQPPEPALPPTSSTPTSSTPAKPARPEPDSEGHPAMRFGSLAVGPARGCQASPV